MRDSYVVLLSYIASDLSASAITETKEEEDRSIHCTRVFISLLYFTCNVMYIIKYKQKKASTFYSLFDFFDLFPSAYLPKSKCKKAYHLTKDINYDHTNTL